MTDNPEITEDEMRRTPLTRAAFRELSNSAHAFWNRKLDAACHPEAGVDALYVAPAGRIEMFCHECKRMAGCVAVAEGTTIEDNRHE